MKNFENKLREELERLRTEGALTDAKLEGFELGARWAQSLLSNDNPPTYSVSDYEWIKPTRKAWIQGAIGLPIEVTIVNSWTKDKEALVRTMEQDWLVTWDKLYKSEEECPCR